MPRLKKSDLERYAEIFDACKDIYNHPAWRRLMDGVEKQIKATEEQMVRLMYSTEKVNEHEIYEARGRLQALHFFHDYGTQDERMGRAAKQMLEKENSNAGN